ncbi:SDR family NAD(P)-dependent oxidoreductase [Agarivorans sp. B2Z047]|nr:SDR family NAD(P)-dependent oxidoreductase [Agarivorans sp. B2Z047]
MESIKNKHFVVSGATSGIGKHLVKSLLKRGAKVSFCGRSSDKLKQLIAELSFGNEQMYYQAFDITEFSQIGGFVSSAIAQLGEIDVLVNNAGVNSARAAVNAINIEDLNWMLKVNFLAPFTFMKEAYNQSMLVQQRGLVINVMSTVCLFSNPNIAAYTASKSGFDSLAKVFRKEAREQGVKVSSIYPGGVDTPFREAEKPEYLAVNDVVEAILTLAQQSANSSIDELVIRPMIERNFS